jgi:short-chain fatty acids transporter
MLPDAADSVYVDPALLKEPEPDTGEIRRPADHLETSRLLSWLIGAGGLAWLVQYFTGGGGLTLNIVNFLFLTLAIILHGTPRRLLVALNEAVKGGAGIVIQFPFYAGIMAIMVQSGLAATVSNWLVSFATAETLPFYTFLSAGIVNFFVPSGGGQWAVQAPVILPAAEALGTDMARASMAVAWGDAWTNMVQPFWALPVLAIAGVNAKDIMGFCLIQLVLSGFIIAIGLTWL